MIRIGFDVLQLGAMCALLCGAMYGTTISPNLVPNGGFETGVEKWAWSQWRGLPAPGGLDTENAFKGQACYRLSLPGEARERFINSHTFAVPEKRNFEFSITLACENVPKNALTVQILQWGTEKTEKPHPQGWVCVPANHGDGDVVKTGGTHPWKTFTVKIPAAVIKPSTKKLSVYIRHKAAGIGVAWADAVSLIATGAGAPAQPAAPSKPEAKAAKPEAKAAKPEAKAAKPEVEKKTGSDRNLLPGDTSFETGSGGWRGASADTATASHGSRSLILAEAKTCRSPKYYGLIKADTPYSFSFSAMTDQPRIDIMVDLWHLRYKIMKRKTFRLSREWRRFTVPVPPQTVDRNFYAVITRQGAGTVRLDAVQFQAGTATAYRSTEPIIMNLGDTGEPGNILFPGENPVTLPVRVANFAHTPETFVVTYETTDYYGACVQEQQAGLSIERGTTVQVPAVVLPRRRVGYYVTTATLEDTSGTILGEATVPFGIVKPPIIAGPDPDSFFGLQGGIAVEARQRIGVKWMRHFRGWRWLERTRKGTITLGPEEYSKHREQGTHLMETLQAALMPDWARGEDKRIRNTDDFCDFAAELVRRSAGYAKYWEIENEPNLVFPSSAGLSLQEGAEYYAEVLNAASAAIRAVDPNAVVMGCGVSGGDCGSFAFSREVFRKAGRAFDVMPLHPYANARFIGPTGTAIGPEANTMRQKLLQAKALVDAFGRGQALWIGELGWSLDIHAPFLSEYAKQHAQYMARAIVLAKSVPEVRRVMWFLAQGCLEKKHYEYGIWRTENSPLPATVAYATLARVLHHAEPVKPLFQSDIRAYAFQQGKTPVIALWKHQGEVTEMLVDVTPGDIRVIDMIGTEREPVEKAEGVAIPVSEAPVYVVGHAISTDALCDRIQNAAVAMEPVKISVLFSDIGSLSGFVKNNLPKRVTGTLSLILPAAAKASAPSSALKLAADGTQSFTFALPASGAAPAVHGKVLTVVADTSSGKVTKTVKIEFQPCLKQTMDLADADTLLGDASAIILRERKDILPPDPGIGWDGPADLSVAARIAWDNSHFYFAADVTDDRFFQKRRDSRVWSGDSIQIAFDPLNDAQEKQAGFDSNDYEFSIALTADGPRVFRTAGPKGTPLGQAVDSIHAVIRNAGTRTTYALAFPWSELAPLSPLAGRMFGFNFIVNDNDGTGRDYWIGLSPGIGEMKYPYCYRKFVLSEDGGGR